MLGGQASVVPKAGTSTVEMIRHLKVARDTAVKGRTQAMHTLEAIIVPSLIALREQLDRLAGKTTLVRHLGLAGADALRVRPKAGQTDPAGPDLADLRLGPLTSTTASPKTGLRAIARRWLALDGEIKDHDVHLEQLTRQRAPELVEAHGIGAGLLGVTVSNLDAKAWPAPAQLALGLG